MDYSKLLNRSVNIVWDHKFLIILGILAALGSGGGGSSFSGSGGSSGGSTGSGQPFGEPGQFPQLDGEIAGLAIGLVIAIICVVLVIGIVLWVISTIARGGLIAGVDAIESGEKSSFSQAWRAAWQKVVTLLGIGFIPAIPGIIILVVGLLGVVAFGGLSAISGGGLEGPLGGAEVGIIAVLLICIVVPVALALTVLRNFAERAAMLENLGVVDSYKRGWSVLTSNLGEAIILFVIQLAIGAVLVLVLFIPSIILTLCCFPLMLAIQGAISAFTSTLWTLAWNEWTGKQPRWWKKSQL